MIHFVHTADIHFGVENYGKIDPATGIHSRLLDFKKNLALTIDYAIEQNADFFLFCGDAYKTANPTPTQQKMFVEELLRLHKANIPVVIIVGNHDHPLSFGKTNALDVFAYLPLDGFYVFSKPDLITITTKNGPVTIVGIPWPTRNNVITNDIHRFKTNTEITNYLSQRVSEIIEGYAAQADPEIPTVLAGHLTVSTGMFSGSEKCAIFGNDPLFLPSQLARAPFDYVALGHLHRYQNLNSNG
ncbi:MAG: exonuclease subunit SbcD, partial [Candidatus Babeliales bacterium]